MTQESEFYKIATYCIFSGIIFAYVYFGIIEPGLEKLWRIGKIKYKERKMK